MTGRVKWFDENKGFGIIKEDSGREVSVHYSDIEEDGYRSLSEGERVEFELAKSFGSLRAAKVKRLDPFQ
ncbi:MAG: cold shock domain-containing protein [Candidatus Latescibacteria bacterium]|nr:cold shock domain-containing protein [Candidatus Latescibacterota bacterium]NIM66444.1 cold shock domain-containing protein [Candidatus Latescibacterota bacterium]NIO02924.1 cold shock domain-containing protein [Candidatus Latescibacterota bacterium]NIO30059.1 cold shock domain-containing protein [Candidatus Latescibacterota bacterium]NIO57674.1 cold shock domain-containing protein [Candidatus Latescibacterota bacterium]